jgi:hypothetical protein
VLPESKAIWHAHSALVPQLRLALIALPDDIVSASVVNAVAAKVVTLKIDFTVVMIVTLSLKMTPHENLTCVKIVVIL